MSAEPAADARAGFEQWLALDETVGRLSNDRAQVQEERAEKAKEIGLLLIHKETIRERTKRKAKQNVDREEDQAQPLVITPASSVPREELKTLFGGRLVRGTFGLTVGPGDVGKGMVMADTIAHLTTGEPFPGEKEWRAPMGVLLCVSEDSKSRVRNRLEAAGADLKLVSFVEGPPVMRGGLVMPSALAFDNDAGRLVTAAKELGAGGLFLETTVEHLGDREGKHRWSSNNEAEVRRALSPIVAVCREANLYGVGIIHPRKSVEGGVEDSISGSAAFRNVARLVLNVYADPLDKTANQQRLLCSSKANHLHRRPVTLRFYIEPWDKDPKEGRVAWSVGHDKRTVEEVWAQIQESRKARRDFAVIEAEAFLEAQLAGGVVKSPEELAVLAKAQMIAPAALRRAKEHLGVESVKGTFAGGWGWRLPEGGL